MATNWWGNMSYNSGGKVTPKQNLQNSKGIADKVSGGSKFVGQNGQWQEVDMWGNPVGQVPVQNQQIQQDPTQKNDPKEIDQKKYGGIAGGYGSGDPAEVIPPEKKEEVAGTGVTPDGGPGKPPFEPIKIAAGKSGTPTGRKGMMKMDRFGGMTLTQEMLSGIPDTDIAKLRDAAAKGPGAFKEFMKMNASAPWYAGLTKSISEQMKSSMIENRKSGAGLAGRVQNARGGGFGDMYDKSPPWMQQRRAENEAKNNPPMSTMPLYQRPDGQDIGPSFDYRDHNSGMQFIDRNQDGVDDRTQGWAPPRVQAPPQQNPYGIPPGSEWDTPEWQEFMKRRAEFERGGMTTGWYPPWLSNQQQGGPQQNPPFDPRILQMLMGGR